MLNVSFLNFIWACKLLNEMKEIGKFLKFYFLLVALYFKIFVMQLYIMYKIHIIN